MNLQTMMKQAQKMQEEVLKEKEIINKKVFYGKKSFIEVEVNGEKKLLKLKIDKNIDLKGQDKEILEDMIVVAVNDALNKVDKEIATKMGKYGSGLSGLI
ncbi:MAG: YbaB/EbfC family nucleoid-associated protein [Bacilli bacterium]|jgi:DNA-binding YbaB/EbfC family protein